MENVCCIHLSAYRGVLIIFEIVKNDYCIFSSHQVLSKPVGYVGQLLSDFEGLEKSLSDTRSRSRILSSNQPAIHNDLWLYFKVQSLGYVSNARGLTSHGSVALSYLPPSEMILSSNKNGTSYWNLISTLNCPEQCLRLALTFWVSSSSTLENPVAVLPAKIDLPESSTTCTRALIDGHVNLYNQFNFRDNTHAGPWQTAATIFPSFQN